MIVSADWYSAILRNILANGTTVGPRGKATREAINVSVRVPLDENIILHPGRAPNYRFMVAEFLWMATGRNELAPLTRYNSKMAAFSDNGRELDGAYGPWFRLGLGRAVRLLREDPDTRQAFIKIGLPLQPASKDVPCTMTWQFLIRDGLLHMVANMRSSDAWLGIPYDVYTFSQLANCVAGLLNVPRGFLYLNLASSHLYAEHRASAEDVVDGPCQVLYGRSAELPGVPPSWVELVLNNGRTDTVWFSTAAPASPEYARLCLAMTAKNSADAIGVLLSEER